MPNPSAEPTKRLMKSNNTKGRGIETRRERWRD